MERGAGGGAEGGRHGYLVGPGISCKSYSWSWRSPPAMDGKTGSESYLLERGGWGPGARGLSNVSFPGKDTRRLSPRGLRKVLF